MHDEGARHPRQDTWDEHFILVGSRLHARTPVGRVTVKLLLLNDPLRLVERATLIEGGLFGR